MEKKDQEEFTVVAGGIEYNATVNWWGYGRGAKDQLEVVLYNDHDEPPSQKYVFKITDETEREAAFYQNRVDGQSGPRRAALVALEKYGFEVTNADIDKIPLNEVQKVGPTLQMLDDTLAEVCRMDDTILNDYPFLLDVLETSLTGIAFVNSMAQPALLDSVGDASDVEVLNAAFNPDESERELTEEVILMESLRDPYNRLYLPELAQYHFDSDITAEDIAESDWEDINAPSALVNSVKGTIERDERFRSDWFDGKRWGDQFRDT